MLSILVNFFGMITFFWGYMFVSFMVKPRKESTYYFSPCKEPKYVIWIIAFALIMLNWFVLAPGIRF